MTDDRQKTVDAIVAKMKSGQKLDEEYVNGYLHLARDHVLMIITTAVLKEKMPGKQVISVFNSLQNAVERYELVHKDQIIGNGAVAWAGAWAGGIFTDQDGNPVEVQYQETKGDA